MSFQIIEILDSQLEMPLARISHQGNQLNVTISDKGLKDITIGESFQAEIGYDKVLGWKTMSDFDDTESGIWQEEDGIHLLGKIHNIVNLDSNKSIIDVYIQNGPEFFTVDTEEINNENPKADVGLEIIVGNLALYPTRK